MAIHPLLYKELVNQAALPILVLNLRNALLVALLAWVAWDVRPAARRGGAPGGTRTHDLQVRNLTLYPLSYGRSAISGGRSGGEGGNSNPQGVPP